MNLTKIAQKCMATTKEISKESLSLVETSSTMELDVIETASLENLSAVEKKCSALRGEIEKKWKLVEEIRESFNGDLLQIQEVEAMIEAKLDELSGGRSNQNALLPVEIESNIKALHIKTKRAKHSVTTLNKILDEGIDAADLPMVATHPSDEKGIDADTLLAEIDSLRRQLDRLEASCAI